MQGKSRVRPRFSLFLHQTANNAYDRMRLGHTHPPAVPHKTTLFGRYRRMPPTGGKVFPYKGPTTFVGNCHQKNFVAMSLREESTPGTVDVGYKFAVASWHNCFAPTDVNGIGGTTPFDALLVIDELEEPTVSDGKTGELQPITQPPDPLYLFDVDDSGVVSRLDALLVINKLPNSQPSASASSLSKAAIVS